MQVTAGSVGRGQAVQGLSGHRKDSRFYLKLHWSLLEALKPKRDSREIESGCRVKHTLETGRLEGHNPAES